MNILCKFSELIGLELFREIAGVEAFSIGGNLLEVQLHRGVVDAIKST